jgi:hypothetical protein
LGKDLDYSTPFAYASLVRELSPCRGNKTVFFTPLGVIFKSEGQKVDCISASSAQRSTFGSTEGKLFVVNVAILALSFLGLLLGSN